MNFFSFLFIVAATSGAAAVRQRHRIDQIHSHSLLTFQLLHTHLGLGPLIFFVLFFFPAFFSLALTLSRRVHLNASWFVILIHFYCANESKDIATYYCGGIKTTTTGKNE